MLDVPAYLERIAYQGTLAPDYATLEALHLARATHIPFENLDILLDRPILLDLGSLQSKLVDARRGGYCYEHNALFASVLREIGLSVTPLAARVRHRQATLLPRAHMCLWVRIDDADWIVDTEASVETDVTK
ncbi:MAG: arylamine N-acetyltransferase [Betaproteobacteria bacterium]|jgi:N-hydroxyarylamine O-acetyltransferase|nr:MAG: arylamine N-acetyltransferase [Betaproteobacteria bacterium]